jgi:predicted type IV restriction endonuclease
MMDDAAFLRFDLAEIAKHKTIDDNTLDGIAAIRKGCFNPQNVGAEAKRKLLFDSIVKTIKQFKDNPSNDFISFVLAHSDSKIVKKTQGIIDANREVIRSAMEAFVAQEVLERFRPPTKDPNPPEPTVAPPDLPPGSDDALSPSEGEMDVYTSAKYRLFFLVRNDTLFQEAQKITFKKTKTTFRVYYGTPNNGSLFIYKEQKDGKALLCFPALKDKEITNTRSPEFDDCLLKSFAQRVTEAGVSFVSPPVLRTIQGGQSSGGS